MLSWQSWYDNLLPEDFYQRQTNTEVLDIFLNYEEDRNETKREKEVAATFSQHTEKSHAEQKSY